ncbi:hypothetical protein HOE04_02690 [archaeon]|jgi:hypothetical protein|nr:hypothetical protein [archaeon]
MEKKQIVFIESYSTVMIYKIAKEFKKRGYKTILIRILSPSPKDKEFHKDAFNQIIDLNFDFVKLNKKNIPNLILNLLKKIKPLTKTLIRSLKLKPCVIIGRANPNLPISFFRILFKKSSFIYFPYDIRVHYAPTKEIAKTERGLSNLEIISEKYNFEKSNGILHKGAPRELNSIHGRYLGKKVKIPKETLYFHPYCSNEFIIPFNKNKLSKKDNELHLVCIGSGGKKTKELYEIYFETAKHLIKQKIHFHIYVSSNLNSEIEEKKGFFTKYKSFPNIKYFHIHQPKNPKEIVSEVSKYDFAISFPPSTNFPRYNLDPKFAVGNRESTFFEAGIPHFYPFNVEYTGKIMERYGLNLPIALNGKLSIKNLKNRIKKLNYKELEKKISRAREDFNLEKQFPRLEKFIIDIANKN